MGRILDKIKAGKILVSDGAWGTLLLAKGLKAGECPELWNVTHTNEVIDIARSYIEAGADMIETNSFGGNRFKLDYYGLAGRTHEINKAAAQNSRMAAGSDHHVLGSIGPTGKLLIMDETTPDELFDVFREQAVALAEGGVDTIVIETMSDLEEAMIAVKAAKGNTHCEIICTMIFQKSLENSFHTMMGISPADMVLRLSEAGADIIGANCGNGIRDMVHIVKEIKSTKADIPVLIQANAGMPEFVDGLIHYPETPAEMASFTEDLVAAGANILGGCCGTTPEHIGAIAWVVKSINDQKTGPWK